MQQMASQMMADPNIQVLLVILISLIRVARQLIDLGNFTHICKNNQKSNNDFLEHGKFLQLFMVIDFLSR